MLSINTFFRKIQYNSVKLNISINLTFPVLHSYTKTHEQKRRKLYASLVPEWGSVGNSSAISFF